MKWVLYVVWYKNYFLNVLVLTVLYVQLMNVLVFNMRYVQAVDECPCF